MPKVRLVGHSENGRSSGIVRSLLPLSPDHGISIDKRALLRRVRIRLGPPEMLPCAPPADGRGGIPSGAPAYRNRIRDDPATVSRPVRSTSSTLCSRSRSNEMTAPRPERYPIHQHAGVVWRLAMPLSSVNKIRSAAKAASTTAGSAAPPGPSPVTVSASWPKPRRSVTSSTGRFSSSLNFTLPGSALDVPRALILRRRPERH